MLFDFVLKDYVRDFMLVALVLAWVVRTLPRHKADTRAATAKEVETLHTMLGLCINSYGNAELGRNGDLFGSWKLVASYWEGTIWLWQDDTRKTSWAVVVRGTSHLLDSFQDKRLVSDTMHARWTSTWQDDADALCQEVQRFLKEKQIDLSRDDVTFVGHSLGASHAEYLLHFFRSRSQDGDNLKGVTFDSPGQPKSFRQAKQMPPSIPGLKTLNAPANIVNTLNPPCAEILYCCGSGSRIYFGTICNGVKAAWHFGARAVFFGLDALREHSMQHRLESMQTLVDDGQLSLSCRTQWPTYSGWFVSVLGSQHKASFRAHTDPSPQPAPAAVHTTPLPHVAIPPANRHPDLLRLPEKREDMLIRKPYKCSNANVDWQRFFDMLTASDKVFALVGDSGQGKTSIFKTLLELPHTDRQLLIADGINTTRFPIVAWMKDVCVDDKGTTRRIFLVDLPGLGGLEQAGPHANDFMQNNAESLLKQIRKSVGAIYYVRRESTIQDESKNRFDAIRQICGDDISLRVIYNHEGPPDREWVEPRRQAISECLKIPKDWLVQCTVIARPEFNEQARERGHHNVKLLLDRWTDDTKPAVLKSSLGTVGDRTVKVEAEIAYQDSQAPLLGSLGGGLVGGGATAYASWAVGAAWWGSSLGKVLLVTSGGVVAAVPLAITCGVAVGSTAVTYGAIQAAPWAGRQARKGYLGVASWFEAW
ncbi:Protein of unknown function DUF2974 [Ceraceosorus bombacis]|uniref:Uncharacterized protein n=1 Tax=Ceraceosorus bombacis TaxID=401625 RepID=A0A0P1B720_9BASI|nr:Protein of unknown function DUF2974 [Ceraceosorus bombacis]